MMETSTKFVILLVAILGLSVCEAKISQQEKLIRLRAEMTTRGYHAVIIPSEDEHQSEYPSKYDLRREWLTGFTGSAGTAVVTQTKAALWTDSRYWDQAKDELDSSLWELKKSGDTGVPSITTWVMDELSSGNKVGQSAKFFSIGSWQAREEAFKTKQIVLENTDPDLIDDIWPEDERDKKPNSDIVIHDVTYAGKTWKEKVAMIQERLDKESADMLIVSALDEVAWLFNLRGEDIPYNPMVISYAIINREGNEHYYYVDEGRADHLTTYLTDVIIKPYANVIADISEFTGQGKRMWVPTSSSYAIYTAVHEPNQNAILKSSPIRSIKARKNDVEIMNARKCHLRDSVARIRHWKWLDQQLNTNQGVTEQSSARKLEEIQAKDPLFVMPSFEPISAVGANAAIVHYSTDVGGKNLTLKKDKIYMLDAGGQYQDCTTDITRTHHFGNPTQKMRFAYTRVMQGSIDLANVVFPNNVYGRELDVQARMWLWKTGLDYGHGTGHGIGYFLGVHEDPPSISYGGGGSDDEFLDKGMIESDEPGYYESGEFGIRLETDLEVVVADTPFHFRDKVYFKFEPLTYVPFDRNLIDECVLTNSQVDWLNKYYQDINKKVNPLLTDATEKSFLAQITQEFTYSYKIPYCSRYSPDVDDDSGNSAQTVSQPKSLFIVLSGVLSVIYLRFFA